MLGGVMVLLGFQLVGEVVARGLGLPVPGPVVGMLLLFGLLLWRGEVPTWLDMTAGGLLRHLGLLFVPAGVGVLAHLGLLRTAWLPLGLAVVLSTLITLGVTGLVLQALIVRAPRSEQ